MKYFFRNLFQYSTFLLLILLVIPIGTADAHVLKSDGSVGAILHVSPDDDPIAGVQTDFFFEIKDKSGTFVPDNCICTASILQNGTEVYSQPLFANNASPNLDNASLSYVLPQRDVYVVQMKGKPIGKGTFEPFTLSWDIRVERDQKPESQTTDNNDVLPYIYALAAVSIVVGVILSRKKKSPISR